MPVPEMDRSVERARGDPVAVRAEVDAHAPVLVAVELLQGLAVLVPEAHRGLELGGDDPRSPRVEVGRAHSSAVSIEELLDFARLQVPEDQGAVAGPGQEQPSPAVDVEPDDPVFELRRRGRFGAAAQDVEDVQGLFRAEVDEHRLERGGRHHREVLVIDEADPVHGAPRVHDEAARGVFVDVPYGEPRPFDATDHDSPPVGMTEERPGGRASEELFSTLRVPQDRRAVDSAGHELGSARCEAGAQDGLVPVGDDSSQHLAGLDVPELDRSILGEGAAAQRDQKIAIGVEARAHRELLVGLDLPQARVDDLVEEAPLPAALALGTAREPVPRLTRRARVEQDRGRADVGAITL